MKRNNDKHTNKIIGAVLSSLIINLMFIVIIISLCYLQFTELDKMPTIIFIVILLLLIIPVIGMTMNLIERIREIKNGEEDEASKY